MRRHSTRLVLAITAGGFWRRRGRLGSLLALLALGLLGAASCGPTPVEPDARRYDSAVDYDAAIQYDAGPPDAVPGDADSPVYHFDHFVMTVAPSSPFATHDFTLTVTAYSSVDESAQMTGYTSTLSITASAGTLSGQTATQTITGGTATLTLSNDTANEDVTLTVTDDVYPTITQESAPFDILPPGDDASPRDVVLNEINWFGNADATDEWIELKNVSGGSLNLSEWTVQNAGSAGTPIVTIDAGTILADGEFLILANLQGPDTAGNRTSLTGVADVQLHSLDLADGGEQLILRDPDGTVIDSTPTEAWAAGHATALYSMERRDDVTGSGYTDGTSAGSWYTWSSLDGTDETNADSTDRGTPGANNTDPDIFHHFSFVLSTPYPVKDTDFDVTATAYSSTDDSVVIATYSGTLSVTASAATLSGEIANQPVSAGVATVTVQHDTVTSGLTLTFTDDIYPNITGTTSSFDIWAGDHADPGDVVLNEINWSGNDNTSDEWIELRNVSDHTIDVGGWVINNAGTSGTPEVVIDPATSIAAGDYLVIGELQGDDSDGNRTSLTGVANVQLHPLELGNGGEVLTLYDVTGSSGTAIDATPAGAWPAGDNNIDHSMERNDDLSGGGYTDGTLASSWHTWRFAGGSDTTSADSSDSGTPGAANSPPPQLLYATGFEAADPVMTSSETILYTPPAGTSARTGTQILTFADLTTSYGGRTAYSDCLAINDADRITASSWVTASTANGGTAVRSITRLYWYATGTGPCDTAHATASSSGTGTAIPEGSYVNVSVSTVPPAGAAYVKVRIDFQYTTGTFVDGDDFAADDVTAYQ